MFVEKDCLAIVMEYAGGGDLHNHVSQQGAVAEPLARWCSPPPSPAACLRLGFSVSGYSSCV